MTTERYIRVMEVAATVDVGATVADDHAVEVVVMAMVVVVKIDRMKVPENAFIVTKSDISHETALKRIPQVKTQTYRTHQISLPKSV